jgi:CCCH-type zinc finger/Zinc finger C-x8-C-x5-C-x3-H type (and similar)
MNQVYQDSLKKENRRNFQNLYNLEVSKDPLAFRGEPEAKIKTEICRNWESGNCEYGDKCFFAHGLKDLREKSNGKALKLQKCESFFKFGYCINGNKCQFRHTDITTDSAVNSLAPGKKKSRSSSQERHIAPVFVDLESRNLYRS